MRLSMCLIAKNEREHVEPCLTSFGAHVDEIIFCDTGSRDGTVAEVRRVCREHGWTDKLVLGRFRWCDDFGAARNYAESLATCEFVCNMDLDETVIRAENLRACCAFLTPDVGSPRGANMLYFQTSYYDSTGWWQRVARRGAFPYVFRVADPRPIRGGVGTVARDVCHWIHRRRWDERPPDRHIRLAQRWFRREPTSARACFELAYELGDAGRGDEAARVLDAFVARHPKARTDLVRLVVEVPSLHALWRRPTGQRSVVLLGSAGTAASCEASRIGTSTT